MSGIKKVKEGSSLTPQPDADAGAAAQLSALAGGIAHDLNTVITTIYGYSEMALEALGHSPEAARNIRRIIAAADRAKLLTGQLLDLSRRAAQEKVPVSVAAVLSDTIDFIRPSVPEGIQIIRRISASEAYVSAVPAQLFRIFLNLVLNAIQAMNEKGGTITVTLGYRADTPEHGTAETGKCLQIRISDTGKGMDEATAAKIFKPFVTAGKENGTGLGLTVVSDAVKELGGTITVSSAVDKGTTFEIFIPGVFFGPVHEKH
ncbi:MAG: ATP-binding protein [Bacteroidota bacterium]|nr:ATP-binding protein [Bacteroidota bacterium]